MRTILENIKALVQDNHTSVKTVLIATPEITDFTYVRLPAVLIAPISENGNIIFTPAYRKLESKYSVQIYVITENVSYSQNETAIKENITLRDAIFDTLVTTENQRLSGAVKNIMGEYSKEDGIFLSANEKIFSSASRMVLTYQKTTYFSAAL